MQKILYIIQKEFIQVVRDKPMLGIIFVAPIIQLILLGYAITTDIKRIPVVICDFDNSYYSRELVRGFRHSGYFNVDYYERNQRRIADYLDYSKATIALVIPDDFSRDLRRNLNPRIQILVDGQDSNSSLIAMGYANNIIHSFTQRKMQESLKKKTCCCEKNSYS